MHGARRNLRGHVAGARMYEHHEVHIEERRLLLDDFFQVEEAFLRYRQINGSLSPRTRRLCFKRGDSVAVLLRSIESHTLILVEQFKYPTLGAGDGWIVETVAGMVDPGEDPTHAARREVEEEVGYVVLSLKHVATFFVSPGGTSERVFLYFGEVSEAKRTGEGGGLAIEGEDIRLREFSAEEAFAGLDDGVFEDAKTIVALQWLRCIMEARK